MKKKFLLIALASLMLTACGKSETSPTDTTPRFYDMGFRSYDDGGAYTAFGSDKKTIYIDYGTMEKTVLCAVPNCSHTTTSCLGAQAKDPVIFGNSIYFFTHTEGMKEYPEGARFEMKSRLMKASIDNSETETVCEFSDAIPRDDDPFVVVGNKLYFIGFDPDVEADEYGGASWSYGGGFDYLCSVDLITGSYTNYGIICYVEDEYPAADKSSRARITGADNGKIYITYEFTKELFDSINNPDDSPEWTFYNFEFDLENETYYESELPAALCAADGIYAWLDDDDDKLHIIKDSEEHVLDYERYTGAATLLNDKLFVSGGWVELSDMIIHYFADQESSRQARAYYDNCYIMTYGNYSFEKLTEDELLALE